MAEEYRLHLQIKRVENGQHLATSDDLPGLVAQGRTVAETVEIAREGLNNPISEGTRWVAV